MLKSLLLICFLQSVIVAGCDSGQNKNQESIMINEIILNGKSLEVTDDEKAVISKTVEDLLSESDDFYELIVTGSIIESIRNNEKFIELIFNEKQTIQTDRFGNLSVKRILVPLTGKYAANGQAVFLTGVNDYSNTPLINSSGLEKLNELIEKFD